MNQVIIQNIEDFVSLLLNKSLDQRFTYHNLSHTKRVVNYVRNLSASEKLNAEETEAAIIAAWFHDTGFTVKYVDHESESIRIATEFLKSIDLPAATIDKVNECIKITRTHSFPGTAIQNVVHDADYCHLFELDYIQKVNQLRLELSAVEGKEFTDKQWWKWNLQFLKQHTFFTPSLRELWSHSKDRIIRENERILKALD